MENLVADTTGLIHLIASTSALISGSLVLLMKKGTRTHIRIGYVYVTSMVVLIATAFMIYRLFNGWGMFHYTTIVSLLTLAFGMLSIWTKKPAHKWQELHFSFMYWSVIGLYAAFAAELFTRIPDAPFMGMVGISSLGIIVAGGIGFKINKAKWADIFRTGGHQGPS